MNESTTSNNTQIIFGPPGTGKTTKLLDVFWKLVEEGASPKEICFIAFTKKAATEARERAIQKFNLEREELPWFRTMHSLAFQQLGVSVNKMMGSRDYATICNSLGLCITYKGYNEDGTFAGQTRGDRLLFAENMARARMLSLKEYWESMPNEDLYWYELLQLHESIRNYKQANDKCDFTDLIYDYIQKRPTLPCEFLIVDEAQDLSPLQWKMVEGLSDNVKGVFIAGDDDQAIFRWAGADTERIIDLPGSRLILDHSYRVPAKIQQVAKVISERITRRVDKKWGPRSGEGSVNYLADISELPLSTGQWLLLARNVFLLKEYVEHCAREGFIFDFAGESPIKANTFKAIVAWETLRYGQEISVEQAQLIYENMSSRVGVAHGFKGRIDDVAENRSLSFADLSDEFGLIRKPSDTWETALDRISPMEREYFRVALAKGEKLAEPRIRISTIHSAKGGEADNVAIITDMAQRTWREFEASPDDEHRVWYVAVTRAKENLFIVSPKTTMCYVI